MSCKLVRRHLGAFVDGELDPASQIEFERHLEACSGCQEHLSFERSFRQQTRDSIGGTQAPEHLWGRALHRLDEIDETKTARSALIEIRPMRWKQTGLVAAAACLPASMVNCVRAAAVWKYHLLFSSISA